MRKVLASIVIAAGTATIPVVASAEASSSDRTTQVGPNTTGPTVSIGSAGFNSAGTQAAASSRTQQPSAAPKAGITAGPDLTYRQIPNNAIPISGASWVDQNGVIHVPPSLPGAACPAGQTGFYVYDATGAFVAIACVVDQGTAVGTAAPSALQLAEQASAQQPWPDLTVNVSPGRGLTGIPSSFWLSGGSPTMPDVTASAGGLTVTVRATLTDVIWDFGDHSTLGSAANVGVQHVYQADSFGMPNGDLVTATLRFRVTYSVNGGPFADLGVKYRPFATQYLVNQLQPEAVKAH